MHQVQHVGPAEPDINERITSYNRQVQRCCELQTEQWVAKLDDGRIVWVTHDGFASVVLGIAMASVHVGREWFSVPIYNVWIPGDPTPPWIAGAAAPSVDEEVTNG